MRWVAKRSWHAPVEPGFDPTHVDDTELIALAPTDRWAFPEFYRRHFFGLAGFVHSRVENVEVAHGIANETMAVAFEQAINPKRPFIVDPCALVYELAIEMVRLYESSGAVNSTATRRVGLDLPVAQHRYDRIEREAELVVGFDLPRVEW